MKKMIILVSLLLIVSARAGDLWVDNVTVASNAAIYGTLNFCNGPATGGRVTNYTLGGTNYTAHIFTNSGSFTVSGGTLTCDVLVVAGGGGGGGCRGGGGGAGGYTNKISHTLIVGEYPVTVGNGGNGAYLSGASGSNSVFDTITATGGGYGARGVYSVLVGGAGGSGGGGSGAPAGSGAGGTGSQGYNGGAGYSGGEPYNGGGGGGASAAGGDGASKNDGGNGASNSISGSSVVYAGGGGGGTYSLVGGIPGIGGTGGGGNGGGSGTNGVAGIANTGAGGGGGGNDASGGNGGSGIIIVRYSISQVSSSNISSLSISSNGINQASASGVNVFMSKVGIGTNNPAEKLHVAGNAKIDGTNIASAITLGGETRTNWPNVAVGALIASNNLSDVADKSAARANLGLGSAATNDAVVFLTTNSDGSQLTNITAAQVGALSTNAGALIAANNLSDVANAGTARGNLGLGSAATNDANAFLSTTGGEINGNIAVNGSVSVGAPAGDIPMGIYTNQ